MHLCMKMNKRMQAMESKGKELVRRKATLLTERHKLLELMASSSSLPVLKQSILPTASSTVDADLDLASIDSAWQQWETQRRENTVELQQRIDRLESEMQRALSNAESRHKKELAEILRANESSKQSQAAPPAAAGEAPVDPTASTAVNTGEGGGEYLIMDPSELNSLRTELEAKLAECESLQGQVADWQLKIRKSDAEMDRLRGVESYQKQQMSAMEAAIGEKNRAIEGLEKQAEAARGSFEEKIVYMQMQLNSAKSRDDGRDKELQVLRKQAEKAAALAEERELSVRSNKDLISALQSRLVELEPELLHAKERCKELDRLLAAASMMKVEQEAVSASLRKELKACLDQREELVHQLRDLQEFRSRAEGQLLKLGGLQEQVEVLSSSLQDATSLTTRLRAEALVSERNHAMRTAMLATCEAQVAQLQKEAAEREEQQKAGQLTLQGLTDELERTRAQLAACEERQQVELNALRAANQETVRGHLLALEALKGQHERELEAVKREHFKKSSMARSLLTEREEEVRHLSARVALLSDEISSGAPSERRILELAQSQARREATLGQQSESREVAFRQLQQSLASRDMDLARSQQTLAELTAEAAELRRTQQREGINMDYLKNIVVQYMTFPMQSSEKLSLVPVIAMLLQFSRKELAEVQRANQEALMALSMVSIWSSPSAAGPSLPPSSRTPKEIKRPAALSSSAASATALSSYHTASSNSYSAKHSSNGNHSNSNSSRGRSPLRSEEKRTVINSSSLQPQEGLIVTHSSSDDESLQCETTTSRGDVLLGTGDDRFTAEASLARAGQTDSDRDLQEKLARINTDILSIHSSSYDEGELLSPPVTPQASPSQLQALSNLHSYSV